MNRSFQIAAVMTLTVAASLPAAGQALAPFVGAWVLNRDASVYQPLANKPDYREMTIEVTGGELVVGTQNTRTVNQETFTTRTTYAAKADGKEYPVPNSSGFVAFSLVSATTLERTARSGRQGTETGTWTIRADRRRLTIKTEGMDDFGGAYSSMQVYDRAPAGTR